MWTISCLYFSWTDIDEIHGDQFLKANVEESNFLAVANKHILKKFEVLNIENINNTDKDYEYSRKPLRAYVILCDIL